MPTTSVLVESHQPTRELTNEAATVFQEEWQVYRKMVDNNYLFHREAYDALHRLLVADVTEPFRFLDLACGDASATIRALRGTKIAHYHGIDLSKPALDLARETLRELPCPVTLEVGDFADALRHQRLSADVVWIGLSLHHFRAPEKLELMRCVRNIVGRRGLFLIYENASPGGETRDAWMERWDLQRADWRAYTAADSDTIAGHVHANDFPETAATWHALGTAAGFGRGREIYVCPTDLFRLYCFQA